MQNVLEKLKPVTIEDIIDYYKKGESTKQTLGLEYERISLNSADYSQARFCDLFRIIETFSKLNNWEILYDNETVIGAKKERSSVSLEPAGQFEISLEPKEDLFEIHSLMEKYITELDEIAIRNNVKFLSIGNNPKICYRDLKIIDKQRYQIMAEYLPKFGKFAPVMMRETAGVQVNVDYENELDAKRKIKACALMSPFLTGFFANSPFRNNKLTNYKSFRALGWKYTGSDRCNLFYKKVIDSNNPLYLEYLNYILDVPMIFIIRNNQYIKINGKITFREFLEKGFENYTASMDDYLIQQSLCFPDIRLKNCIEIRNHDSQNLEIAIAIASIYKGILYNKKATDKILNYLEPLNSDDLNQLGFISAKRGIDFRVEKLNKNANEVTSFILSHAQSNLNQQEKRYLDFLIELAESNKCIADMILENIKNNTE